MTCRADSVLVDELGIDTSTGVVAETSGSSIDLGRGHADSFGLHYRLVLLDEWDLPCDRFLSFPGHDL